MCRASLPPSPTPFPVLPHFSPWATTRVAPTPLTPRRHSGSKRRTQTSSFRAQSRNPCPPALQHGCCDYAQHDGVCRARLPPSPTPFPVIPHFSSWATTRVAPTPLTPPRHPGSKRRTQTSSFRAQSRNPCPPALQHGCCDYAQHDGVCRASLPPSPTPFPVIPHFSSWATTRVAPTPLTPPRHPGSKRRSQTSSFRAQSRNPCPPALQHRCCDYAQHDGVCRAPLPPSPTPVPVLPHFSSGATTRVAPTPLTPPRHPGSKRRTQTSSFRAQSRNPCPPALQHGCCDYAQHDGVCRATLPPSPTPFPVLPHFSPWATTRVAPTPLTAPRHPGSKRRTQTSSFRAQSRNPCPPALQHGCCDYAQHDGVCRARLPPSPTPFPVLPHFSSGATTRVAPTPLTPPRHPGSKRRTQTSSFRAQSRNPCPPALQHGCCDYAQHDGVCRATLPPSPTPFPVIPHFSSWATTRVAPTPLTPPRHSGSKRRTQTSSFRAQSRNPFPPALQHGCCDYAQHDGVCRATLPPSPTPFPVIPHFSPWATTRVAPTPLTPRRHSGSKRRTQTSSFRAQSRNPCPPALQHGCCDYAQHDGVCRATLPPSPTPFPVIPHFSSWATTRVAPTPLTPPRHSGSKRRTQTSSFRAQSRNPCPPALQHGCCDYAQHDGVCRASLPPSPTPFPVIPHFSSWATTRVAPTPLTAPRHPGSKRRTQTSSFRAQSRNPCPPALQHGCCDYAQHDGVCRARLPPSPTPFPVLPHSAS